MKNKLGEDPKVYEKVKTNLEIAFKNKYFKLGYKSAAKGKARSENPYSLPEECWDILRKRTYFDLGWEQKAFSKTEKQLKEIAKRNEEFKRIEKLAKEKRKYEEKHKHGKHSKHGSKDRKDRKHSKEKHKRHSHS